MAGQCLLYAQTFKECVRTRKACGGAVPYLRCAFVLPTGAQVSCLLAADFREHAYDAFQPVRVDKGLKLVDFEHQCPLGVVASRRFVVGARR